MERKTVNIQSLKYRQRDNKTGRSRLTRENMEKGFEDEKLIFKSTSGKDRKGISGEKKKIQKYEYDDYRNGNKKNRIQNI